MLNIYVDWLLVIMDNTPTETTNTEIKTEIDMKLNYDKVKTDIQQELSAMHDIGMISDELVADACLNVEMASDEELEQLGWMKTCHAADLVLDWTRI